MASRRPNFVVRAAAILALIALFWSTEGRAAPTISRRAALGRRIFFDPALSEPKGTSCASCHDPALAFSGDHRSGVGVASGSRPGQFARRATPSLLYLQFVPKFRFHSDDDDKHALDQEPYGGFFWDGRADSIADLASQPLLNPREMNNADISQIAHKIARAPYASDLRAEFPSADRDPEAALAALGASLAAFLTLPEMAPFSSKYDAYIRGESKLSAREAEGLDLFKDKSRAGCAKCHTLDDHSRESQRSLFTDYGYEAVGAPRNKRLALRDEDRGLCERTNRENPSDSHEWCASFRTPSLRNVALRKSFMHNGAFTSLRDVVSFYATRASNSGRWYPSGIPFDDTPADARALINVSVAPYDRSASDGPVLTEREIDAIVAFLGTLTDKVN